MNNSILRRLKQLEDAAPDDLIVEYRKEDEKIRKTMKVFCSECRADGIIYNFKVIDGNKMDDIDMLICLIDDYAKMA